MLAASFALLPSAAMAQVSESSRAVLFETVTAAPTAREHASPFPEWRVGPVHVTGGPIEGAGASGIRITAALPVAAVPGLDAVVTATGGRDVTTEGGTVGAATVTAGLRLRF